MYARMDDAEVTARNVARIYAQASDEIIKRMRDIFRVYQEKWSLTEKEARDLLASMDGGYFNPQSLRRAINLIADEELKQKMLRDLETPAYQARLRRLQELQDQLDRMMTDVYQQDSKRQREHYIRTGTDTYYRGIYDVQRQVGFQFSFAHIDQKAFDRLLKSKWSGKNYSARIWDNTQHVADTVKDELMLELLTGKRLDDCAEAIQHRFHVGAYQSRRIIRTESNFVSGQMQKEAYKECGAEYYEYVATLDSRTDEECGVLDGRRFKLSEAQPGVNFHPMHPFCRCSDVIALDDDVKNGLQRRARDLETGENIKVPASTSYMQWARDNGLEVKQRKVVELPESTKSRTKMNDPENERGHKGKRRDTEISRSIIESPDYSRRLSNVDKNRNVSNAIISEARRILEHRNGTLFEDLMFIDTRDGTFITRTDYNRVRGVMPSKRMRKKVEDAPDYTIASVHNHPGSTVPSPEDINILNQRKNIYGVILCHNGDLYKYSVDPKRFNWPAYASAFADLDENGYNKDTLNRFIKESAKAGVVLEVL